ncbi:TonB-dependent receptor family protein [Sphingomonas jatrophae]|uniref:Iron complex outermembrane recepter protein n=1 Tax=Sphingomonas jatrophae TaxID=1166337 RepID=A0A1I6JBH5_9SPHN|nr:TonB-dependent receptor [Sphingomonas jatrophae]SFR76264.1 iron complex outermembrane recepter protein [Sphingomonas jatrophae]
MTKWMIAGAALTALGSAASAQVGDGAEARRAELLRQRALIDEQLRALDTPVAAAPVRAPSPAPATEVVVTAKALSLTTQVQGQTVTTVDDRAFRNTPATTIADIVKLSPGVAVIQGNGPRDVGVSIRGSNARNSFGARNIQVFEDDFPVTQPDGLARFDLTDPHAYGAVDVVRGPSSARYGNYALGGAVNFRTRRGRDIDGLEAGFDAGGDGYANFYATLGGAGATHEYSLFGSFARADGATGHTGYETGTINAYGTFELGERDRVAAKVIYNEGEFRLSTRLSFNQYLANPYQRGCEAAATAAPGCGTISVLANGVNGARIAQTAAEGDLARNDRRTIAGVRYEHDFGPATVWRTQATFDSRVVNQPTSATPFKGTLDSYNITSDVTDRGTLLGLEATSFVQLFYNYLDNQSFSFNKTPAGRNGFGALVSTTFGDVRNMGARAREEVQLTPKLRLVAGIGAERSIINQRQTSYAYPLGASPTQTLVPALRRFWNVAPEAALVWQALDPVRLHARVGTGYGIPQSGQLFVTPEGVFGNNTALKAQRNTGVDVGAEITLGDTLRAEITGYYEWFRNELVSQSAGVNLQAYTSNVPRSVHRGIEIGVDWQPLPGALPGARVQASYSYNDHHYTDFQERLTAGTVSRLFDREGNAIPGVIPTFVNALAAYDQPAGPLAGLGGFAEVTYRERYYIDNANALAVPGYTLVNLNLHYDPPRGDGWWSRVSLFASVQNLFDKTYVGSAGIVANSFVAATGQENGAAVLRNITGSIYAGQPRTLFAGVKTRF